MTQTTMPVEQRTRCVGRKVDGTRCTRLARAGETECRQHAGLAAPHAPTGLSDDDQTAIFEALADGLSLEAAIVEAGVSRSTVYDWLARARQEGSHPAYREFEAGIARTRTHLERWTMQQLKDAAGGGNVSAMRALLQRVSPHARNAPADDGQLRMPTQRGRRGAATDDETPDNVVPLNPTGTDDFDW